MAELRGLASTYAPQRTSACRMGWTEWSPGEKRAKTVSSSVPWKYQSSFGGSSDVGPGEPVLKGTWGSQHLGLLVTARSQDGRKVALKLGDPPQFAAVEKPSTASPPPPAQSPFSEPASTVSEADRREGPIVAERRSP